MSCCASDVKVCGCRIRIVKEIVCTFDNGVLEMGIKQLLPKCVNVGRYS